MNRFEDPVARAERYTWLHWKPFRVIGPVAFAMVDAMMKSKTSGDVSARIIENVRRMK